MALSVDYALQHGQWVAPSWASSLRNLYWHIRSARRECDRRSAYRCAQKEKDRLLDAGIDPELLRLACRYFKCPSDRARALRVAHYQERLERVDEVEEFTGCQVWAGVAGD